MNNANRAKLPRTLLERWQAFQRHDVPSCFPRAGGQVVQPTFALRDWEIDCLIAEARQIERERCALIADAYDQVPGDDTPMGPTMEAQVGMAQQIAADIRKDDD